MNNLTVATEDTFASLLELAANNDIEGFKQFIDDGFSGTDEVGLWYGRQKGSRQMVFLHRTPLMVASTYGSIDIVKLIISFSETDLNKHCGVDQTTALHCAASGGSINAIDVVKLLLEAGADPNSVDANGNFPIDVIVVPPKLENLKTSLKELLSTNIACNLRVLTSTSNSNSPSLSPENGSPSSPLDSNSSPNGSKINDLPPNSCVSEKREYPVDPSLPDIKNSIYSTDEFRMFSFKVRPCSRAYSHDWTECPFVHPGENARRRDPRKYHYSCVPCPDFRKGACRRGDMCEYAHGVFESWLHPAQYRTRICKDGTGCNRRVCFFAHTPEELRPLYVSTGSAVPSPRFGSSIAADFAAAMSLISNSPTSPFTPPLSPSLNGNMGWPPQTVPSLHLPSNNFQSSRLRSSLHARDIIQPDDMESDFDFDMQQQQILNEMSRLTQPSPSNLNLNDSRSNLTPSNLDDLFSAENSSPRYNEQGLSSAVFSPTHKSALLNQFQQQKSMLSPINTSFSPKPMDHPLMQSPFASSSSGRMSPRRMDPVSPMSAKVSMLREKQQTNFRSFSSRDLGSRSTASVGIHGDTAMNWGSPSGKVDWATEVEEYGKLRKSSSFELKNNMEEPDFGWVHSLVKETPQEIQANNRMMDGAGSSGQGSSSNQVTEPIDSVLEAWLENMQLDKFKA